MVEIPFLINHVAEIPFSDKPRGRDAFSDKPRGRDVFSYKPSFRKAITRSQAMTLLKGHTRSQDEQSPESTPENARHLLSQETAICKLLKIDVIEVLDVVNSD